MNKRKVKITFTSLITCVIFTLASCGGDSPSGHTHTWSTIWSQDETYHWHKCTTCDAISDKEVHNFESTIIEPDYEHQGYTRHECSICHYFYDDNYVEPLEHHYSSSWSSDETYHWHACIDDGYESLYLDKADHEFGEWIIDIPASEISDGTRHHVCNICNKSVSETYEYEEYIPVERVYLASSAIDLFNGYTYSLSPATAPYNATSNLKYEVENPEMLSVNDNVALAKSIGSTLVYIYDDIDNDDIRDEEEAFTVTSFNITNPDPSKGVSVEEEITIKVDEVKALNYSPINIQTFGTDYGFYSEDQSICTISAGKLKGHRPGKTRVSVSLQGYRGYCNVTVINNTDESGTHASEIETDKFILLNKGESKVLSYTIHPSIAIDTLESVTSNNEEAVKVNADKSITALTGGTARIKLTTTNGKYAYTLVTVKADANNTDSYYNNYYGNLSWTNSKDLISKLHDIISNGVTPLRYNNPTNWETNQMADQDLYDHSLLNCVYIDSPLLKSATNTGWQREHAFCASLMSGYSTGSAVTALGRATDFHNLFAAGGGANGSRGNKNLGYVRQGSVETEQKENCLFDKKTFEPNDEDKGKLARALLYMSIMYNEEASVDISETWTYKGDDISTHTGSSKSMHAKYEQQALKLVHENIDWDKISLNEFMMPKASNETIVNYYRSLVKEANPTLEDDDYDQFRLEAYQLYLENALPYAIGNIYDILEWNSFPVSLVEMQHNESVYSYNSVAGKGIQGNRNPFVDYPQLVEYIYGDLKDEPGSLSELIPSYLTLKMNVDEIHHYSVESELIPPFVSGTKPTVDDFNIKAIKNDLTVGTLDIDKISVEDYTFTDEDVENGKVIKIFTDKNTLEVPCKVISESVPTFDTCSWKFESSGSASDYSGSGGSWSATLSGVAFNVTSSNTSVSISNRPSSLSARFGTTSVYCSNLTFVTQNSFIYQDESKINAIFFSVGFGSSITANYTVSIGSTIVLTGTCKGATSTVYGGYWSTPLEGIVTISFTNVTSYADVHGFAINTVI